MATGERIRKAASHGIARSAQRSQVARDHDCRSQRRRRPLGDDDRSMHVQRAEVRWPKHAFAHDAVGELSRMTFPAQVTN